MKTLLIFLLPVLLSSFFPTDGIENTREVKIGAESTLFIKGTSSVNTFICNYDASKLQTTKTVGFQKTNNRLRLEGASLQLQNTGFNCGNKGINKDFHELLKTDKFPHITLDVNEIHTEGNKATSLVTITIAGIQKSYRVPVSSPESKNSYEGVLCINILDFNLIPPKKMMGLIVVHEEIEINFNLDLGF